MDRYWSESAAAWVDVNNDGLLDLFVVNYVHWNIQNEAHVLATRLNPIIAIPSSYKGQPNQLFLNNGDGTFRDVSKNGESAITSGKAWAWAWRTTICDGKSRPLRHQRRLLQFLFHNLGNKFEEVAFEAGVRSYLKTAVSFPEWASISAISTMTAIRTSSFVALIKQTFPLASEITGKGDFEKSPRRAGMRDLSYTMSGLRRRLLRFRQRWMERSVRQPRTRRLASRCPATERRPTTTPSSAIPAQTGNGKP